jgi:cation transport regulator
MPYNNIKDLPDNIQNVLPKHAKEIYLKAFNHAWEEYENPEKRKTDESREEVSHKVAWAAVKTKYHKDESGNWVEK